MVLEHKKHQNFFMWTKIQLHFQNRRKRKSARKSERKIKRKHTKKKKKKKVLISIKKKRERGQET